MDCNSGFYDAWKIQTRPSNGALSAFGCSFCYCLDGKTEYIDKFNIWEEAVGGRHSAEEALTLLTQPTPQFDSQPRNWDLITKKKLRSW